MNVAGSIDRPLAMASQAGVGILAPLNATMVIPIRDHNPTRRTPFVNWLLLAVNVFVFVFAEPWSGTQCQQQAFFLRYAAIPDEIATGQPLDAREVAAVSPRGCELRPVTDKPVYASVLTAMFLHAGWAHLLGNMLYLAIFGNNVEDRFGHLRYLVFYLAAGAIATLVFAYPNAASVSTLVGASGAIAGVLGAYLLMFPRARITSIVPPLWLLPFRLPALVVLGLWFVMQVVQTRAGGLEGGGVAYLAHVAGFVAGFVLTVLFAPRPPPRPAFVRRRF
jgi:membrane associated rhomboid family serine protease